MARSTKKWITNIQQPSNAFPSKAEIVIIGGGVIGTVTAYVLARAGMQVLLVERGDIGAGTSSSSAAAALLQTKTSAKKLALANQSLALLDDLHEQLDGCFEYSHTGSLLAASTEAEMHLVHEMNATLQSLGLGVELVDGEQARRIMPVLGPGVMSGSYSPRDAQINPLELMVASAEAASQHGAILATYTDLLAVETTGDRILAVQTSAGRVLTDTVINAAGVWAPEITRMTGLDIPVTPLKGELLVTERMPACMRGTLIAAKYLMSKANLERDGSGRAPVRSVGITLVQVAHGNFIIGSTRELAGYDCRNTYSGIHEMTRQLLELTPGLANVHLLRAYAGLRPITPDGYPIIGRSPHLPGFILATGFGGDGLAMSAITAQIILSILLGNGDPDLLATFSVERFTESEMTV